MSEQGVFVSRIPGKSKLPSYLLFRGALDRANGDLDKLVSLLIVETMQTNDEDMRFALADNTTRVSLMSMARKATLRNEQSLKAALKRLCTTLVPAAQSDSIAVSCDISEEIDAMDPVQVSTVKLVVHELATNAIKHAFQDNVGGKIAIAAHRSDAGDTVVTVDDDGLPFPELDDLKRTGIGFDLVKTLVASIGASIEFPSDGSKRFRITLPATPG